MTKLPMFRCAKLDCRLTKRSCGMRWRRANALKSWSQRAYEPDGLRSCTACPIGRANARRLP